MQCWIYYAGPAAPRHLPQKEYPLCAAGLLQTFLISSTGLGYFGTEDLDG